MHKGGVGVPRTQTAGRWHLLELTWQHWVVIREKWSEGRRDGRSCSQLCHPAQPTSTEWKSMQWAGGSGLPLSLSGGREDWGLERLPAVADVPEPGLLPQAPAAVESDRGVVETPPGCLAELVHHGWLPCTGRLVSSLIQGICTDRRVSWFWARFLFVALWCPAGRRARTD